MPSNPDELARSILRAALETTVDDGGTAIPVYDAGTMGRNDKPPAWEFEVILGSVQSVGDATRSRFEDRSIEYMIHGHVVKLATPTATDARTNVLDAAASTMLWTGEAALKTYTTSAITAEDSRAKHYYRYMTVDTYGRSIKGDRAIVLLQGRLILRTQWKQPNTN